MCRADVGGGVVHRLGQEQVGLLRRHGRAGCVVPHVGVELVRVGGGREVELVGLGLTTVARIVDKAGASRWPHFHGPGRRRLVVRRPLAWRTPRARRSAPRQGRPGASRSWRCSVRYWSACDGVGDRLAHVGRGVIHRLRHRGRSADSGSVRSSRRCWRVGSNWSAWLIVAVLTVETGAVTSACPGSCSVSVARSSHLATRCRRPRGR